MTRGLADTSVFVAREGGRPLDLDALPDELAVSVITLGELRAGVLVASDGQIRERRLSTYAAALALAPVPIDARVADRWARLRVALRDAGRRIPVNDSWIAATAMALEVPVVTQDDDFPAVGGLETVRV
jgi:predicted nucleic acid-binding protein